MADVYLIVDVQGGGDSTSVPAATSSSFGMSGVNAHMLLTPSDTSTAGGSVSFGGVHWQRTRHWLSPPLHSLLSRVGAKAGICTFTVQLSAVGLNFMQDHQVRKNAFPQSFDTYMSSGEQPSRSLHAETLTRVQAT